MKRIISLVMAFVILVVSIYAFSVSLEATDETSGSCGDNLVWEYDLATLTLTISGTGDMYDYTFMGAAQGISVTSAPWNTYYKQIRHVVIEEGVTSIGKKAFYMCDSIFDVKLPSSVTFIGDEAFMSCRELVNINLPKKLIYLGSFCFANCTYLYSVTLPDSLTAIENSTFARCKYLKEITFSDNLVRIGDYAFELCESLKEVNIPETVMSIGESPFYGCSSLETVCVPAGVTTFNNWFYYCMNIKRVNVSENNDAFCSEYGVMYSKDMTELIYVPSNYGVSNYSTPQQVTKVGEFAFVNSSFSNIVIGDNVETVGLRAFEACSRLSKVKLPDTLKDIPEYLFYDCRNIKSVDIGNSVERIGENAFTGCFNLQTITFPDTLERIGAYAFKNCNNLSCISYTGEKEEFGNIIIEEGNERILNAKRYYICKPGEHNFNYYWCEKCGVEDDNFFFGDADGDRGVTISDLILVRRTLAGYTGLILNLQKVDINMDGIVDSKDLLLLRKMLVR